MAEITYLYAAFFKLLQLYSYGYRVFTPSFFVSLSRTYDLVEIGKP